MDFKDDQLDGKEIAERVVVFGEVDAEQLSKWIEGASDRILQQEKEINTLKFQIYLLLFFVFVLPAFLSINVYNT